MLSGMTIVLVWSAWYVVSRWGVLGNMTPADITLVRYVTGAIVTLPFFLRWRGRTIPWKPLIVLVLTYGFPYAFTLYLGLAQTPAANAGVLLNGLLPIVNASLAWVAYRQGVSRGKWVAIGILAAANACMLVAGSMDASLTFGWLWIIVATLLLSVYLTVYRQHPVDIWILLPAMSMGNLLLFLPLWPFLPSTMMSAAEPYEILVQVFFQGIINQVLIVWLISITLLRLGSVTTSVLYGFVPVVTALFGWLFLGEFLVPLELLGIAGCVFGIIVFSRAK